MPIVWRMIGSRVLVTLDWTQIYERTQGMRSLRIFPISFYLRLEWWLCGVQKEVIVVENLSHLPPARAGSENVEYRNDPDY